jgi:hypothetical protein
MGLRKVEAAVDELMEQTELPESATAVDFYMHFLDCLSPLMFSSSFHISFPAGWMVYHFCLMGINAYNISCMYRKKKKIDIHSTSISHCITELRMLLHNQTRWFKLIFVQVGTHLESRLATLL